LAVKASIRSNQTAAADGTFAHGWQWVVAFWSLPGEKNSFSMRFNDSPAPVLRAQFRREQHQIFLAAVIQRFVERFGDSGKE